MKDPNDKLTQGLPGVEPPRRGRPATGQMSPAVRKRAQRSRDIGYFENNLICFCSDTGLLYLMTRPDSARAAFLEFGKRRKFL